MGEEGGVGEEEGGEEGGGGGRGRGGGRRGGWWGREGRGRGEGGGRGLGGGGGRGWGRDTIGQYCPITRKAGRVCAAAIMAKSALSSSKSINHQPPTGKGIESSPNWKRGGASGFIFFSK